MSQDFDAPEFISPEPESGPAAPPATPATPPETPAAPKPSGPKLKIPTPPNLPLDDPEQNSPYRRLARLIGINFLLLLIVVSMLGFVIYRQSRPSTGAAGGAPEEVKSVASEVDRLKAEVAGLSKKIGEMPAPADPSPQIKSLDEKVAELGKTVADVPARLESLGQKVDSAPKADAIEKKLGELAQAVDALKAGTASKAASPATRPVADVNVEGQAMEQAADLFKQGKYAEAREAFTRLQSVYPDDARVWYFSALANSLATRNWQGESERLARVGVEREKAGTPEKAKIDAVFASLTPVTGKDWLAFFRKQAVR